MIISRFLALIARSPLRIIPVMPEIAACACPSLIVTAWARLYAINDLRPNQKPCSRCKP